MTRLGEQGPRGGRLAGRARGGLAAPGGLRPDRDPRGRERRGGRGGRFYRRLGWEVLATLTRSWEHRRGGGSPRRSQGGGAGVTDVTAASWRRRMPVSCIQQFYELRLRDCEEESPDEVGFFTLLGTRL